MSEWTMTPEDWESENQKQEVLFMRGGGGKRGGEMFWETCHILSLISGIFKHHECIAFVIRLN